jgi:hypothetical protein
MNISEIIQTICGVLFGLLVFIAFLLMFSWAVLKGEFIFSSGKIRGKLARIIGVIGLLGMIAGIYLAVSILVFHIEQPPLASIANFFFVLLIVVLLAVRFLSLFFWRSK